MIKLVEVKNVTYKYPDGFIAIDDMNFDINKGEKVGLIGANGAGKSTLLQLLVGIFLTKDASIKIDNIPINKKNLSEIRKKIGFIFQDSDNQLFMNKVKEDISFGLRNTKLSNEEINNKIKEVLEYLNISQLENKNIYMLSGGQKKLVSIAGILVMNPEIILMDEPSAALDPKARRNLINLLIDLDKTLLIASHDLDMILDVCDRVILLDKGKILYDGNAKEILYNKELLEEANLELPLRLSSQYN